MEGLVISSSSQPSGSTSSVVETTTMEGSTTSWGLRDGGIKIIPVGPASDDYSFVDTSILMITMSYFFFPRLAKCHLQFLVNVSLALCIIFKVFALYFSWGMTALFIEKVLDLINVIFLVILFNLDPIKRLVDTLYGFWNSFVEQWPFVRRAQMPDLAPSAPNLEEISTDNSIVGAPSDLGVEVVGGYFCSILSPGPDPKTRTVTFSTYSDYQSVCRIRVYQGERVRASDNHLLGTFDLTGITPAPRGVPQIEVTFETDVNGILTVSALDKSSGKENKITITDRGCGFNEVQDENMVSDGEGFEDDNDKQEEKVSAKISLESYCFNMKTIIEEERFTAVISEDDKKKIVEKCDEAIWWVDANQLAEVGEIQDKQKEVEDVCNSIITCCQAAGVSAKPELHNNTKDGE